MSYTKIVRKKPFSEIDKYLMDPIFSDMNGSF